MPEPVTDVAAVAAEIDRIRSLTLDALRRRWRLEFGRKPATGLSKDLLGRMIAWRVQERAFGGLDRESLAFLDSLAGQAGGVRTRQLKPGTVLVRDYQGRRHTVTVTRDGFEWQGTSYGSLSAIARAITGTAWSGPRFFALQNRRPGAKAATPTGEHDVPKHRRAAAHLGRQAATAVKPSVLSHQQHPLCEPFTNRS